jgi:hypothetical protein
VTGCCKHFEALIRERRHASPCGLQRNWRYPTRKQIYLPSATDAVDEFGARLWCTPAGSAQMIMKTTFARDSNTSYLAVKVRSLVNAFRKRAKRPRSIGYFSGQAFPYVLLLEIDYPMDGWTISFNRSEVWFIQCSHVLELCSFRPLVAHCLL